MFKIFLGMVFTLLSYDIRFAFWGSHSYAELIPHFIGFIFVLAGTRECKDKSSYFDRVEPVAYIMIVYSLANFLVKLLGLTDRLEQSIPFLVFFLELAAAIGTLLVSYMTVFAISNMEYKNKKNYSCKRLQMWWKFLTWGFILYYISYVTNLVTANTDFWVITTKIAMVFNLVKNVVTVVFLFFFYQTWAKYMESTNE